MSQTRSRLGSNALFWLRRRFVLRLVLVLVIVLVLIIAIRSIIGRRFGDAVEFHGHPSPPREKRLGNTERFGRVLDGPSVNIQPIQTPCSPAVKRVIEKG